MDVSHAVVSAVQRSNTGKVPVYRFRYISPATGESFPSLAYATREAIERFEAEIIVSTRLDVNPADINEHGCYDSPPPKVENTCIPAT